MPHLPLEHSLSFAQSHIACRVRRFMLIANSVSPSSTSFKMPFCLAQQHKMWVRWSIWIECWMCIVCIHFIFGHGMSVAFNREKSIRLVASSGATNAIDLKGLSHCVCSLWAVESTPLQEVMCCVNYACGLWARTISSVQYEPSITC